MITLYRIVRARELSSSTSLNVVDSMSAEFIRKKQLITHRCIFINVLHMIEL
jgi:hypothetical protein